MTFDAHWFDRRNGRWDEFDQDPARSYYKFLRAVYQMTAREAYDRAKAVLASAHE